MDLELSHSSQPQFLNSTTARLLKHQVTRLRGTGDFRPKTNLIITHNDCILQSKSNHKADDNHSFFGGGIDEEDKDIESAILRELFEETKIEAEDIAEIIYLGQNQGEFRQSQQNRDGFRKGQHYFYFLIKLKPGFNRHSIVYETGYEGVWVQSSKQAVESMRQVRQNDIAKILSRNIGYTTPHKPRPASL